MYSILYLSTKHADVTTQDIRNIYTQSIRNNSGQDLTGMLAFSKDIFLQVLEGDKDDILATFAKIKKDWRHENIVVLSEGSIEKRTFAKWAMAYKTLSDEETKDFGFLLKWEWSKANIKSLKQQNDVAELFITMHKALLD
ncbi:BLUF domain-containing protein [Temperatibacter marinus]|uniref:BLUF domain-containing protein n=1 Tax=Temperatibacter marinus TaxID=1456591 RepID=A0AA52EH52_9PROT|nr:BLUF domain-containing protein [Temperatibacter marinus]WND03063.1 BLUF domain-containing protein [Temperatibacter marinus]